jgi:hypothetical protein
MKKTFLIFIILSSCFTSKISAQNEIDSTLLKELERMIGIDQLAASKSGSSEKLSTTEWADSVYRAHKNFAENILDKDGFPGFDKLGKRGSNLYFALVQHSDFDVNFQKRALDSMYQEVQVNNADPRDFAYLQDRVQMNTGKKLLNGTQVDYHWFSGKARYLPTIDPENLNKRRADIGLEPIEVYLEEMTEINNEYSQPMVEGITNLALILIIALIVTASLITLFLFKRKKAIDNNGYK